MGGDRKVQSFRGLGFGLKGLRFFPFLAGLVREELGKGRSEGV